MFIDPPFKRFTGFSNPYFPVGLAYLSAVCNQNGHTAVVYEVDAVEKAKTIDMDFSHEHQKLELYKKAVNDITNPIWDEIVQTVRSHDPDVIGITVMTTKIASAIRTAKKLKEEFSNIPILVGGPHATLLPEQCFKVDSFDYVMRGESERTILPFLSFIEGKIKIGSVKNLSYHEKSGKIVHNPVEKLIENLDEIPFPDRDSLLYKENYSSEDIGIIMAARGCPFCCTYCSHIFGRRVRKRSVDNIIEEIQLLKEKYETMQVSFKDDTFTVDNTWVTQLCNRLIKDNIRIHWDCTTRVDTVNEDLIKLMKKAGCNDIRIGVETGSQHILNETKKGITFDEVRDVTKILNKNRMMWTGYFMYGLPTEKVEDIQNTYAFMEEINPNYAGLGLYNPFPKTELFDLGVKLGLLEEDVDIDYFFKTNPKDYYFKDPQKRVVNVELDEFQRIEREIQAAFSRHNMKFSNLARRAIGRKYNYFRHPEILVTDILKGLRMTVEKIDWFLQESMEDFKGRNRELMYSAYITTIEDLKKDIIKSLGFIHWKSQVKKDSVVFVKPNFTYPFYKEGVTTSPELMINFLEILKGRADTVIVGESDGGKHSFSADDSFKGHGMYDICRETGVELVNLSTLPSKFVEDEIQGKRVKVQLPKLLLEKIDCFISVPVLKVHVMTGVTLSMKNLWGCYPDTMRCLHHEHLSYKLALITKLLNPKIILIDGIYSLTGHGPMYGESKKTNLIISSNNPVVSDSLGAAVMGMPLKKIEHILIAEKEGLGTTDLSTITINKDWNKFKMQFYLKKTLLDRLSVLPFKSDILANLITDSSFTPMIDEIARFLRTHEEQDVVNDLRRYY